MILATQTVTAREVQAHYDELDSLYRKLWGHHLHHGLWICGNESKDQATQQLIDKIAVAGSIRPSSRICDIGCGYGGTSQVLAETFHASVTGVTITPSQYEIARMISPSKGKVEFLLEDWLQNSLPSEAFDHAIAIESSEHAVDKLLFFKQAARVLKPNGSLTICAWMANDKLSRFEETHLLTRICDEGRLPSLLTEDNYKDVLQNSGFEITHTEDLTDQVKKTWNLVIKEMIKFSATHPFEFRKIIKSIPKTRDFFWTPLRMRLAYETHALRYVLMSSKKTGR